MSESIVLLLDGTPCTPAALRVACTLRDLGAATLHVMHAAERSPPPRELIEQLGLDAASLRGCVIHDAAGDVSRAVLELAARERARAIVLCTTSASDAPRRSLGEHARGVLAEATVPVVLVRPDAVRPDWELREVLLPHDGTPATTQAIRPAATIARDARAKLLALHVATPGKARTTAAPRRAEPGSLPVPRYVDQPQHEWPAWASEFLERLEATSPLDPGQVRLFLGQGETGSEVLRVAETEHADLIVLAWHGTLDPDHAQVFKALLRHAPCPLMVLRVPAAGARRSPRPEMSTSR